MSNWDTEETGRIIENDEGLYDLGRYLARRSSSTSELADRLETEIEEIIQGIEWCKVDTDKVDWLALAVDIMDEAEE